MSRTSENQIEDVESFQQQAKERLNKVDQLSKSKDFDTDYVPE